MSGDLILAIDIGGSFLKAGLLAKDGALRSESLSCPTPLHATPAALLQQLVALAQPLSGYGKISIGFPGAIRRGIILTAPNIGTQNWAGTDFAALAAAQFGCPVRLANDATMHGLGVIAGVGVEVVLTLGTGMGFALFSDGTPAPQIELGRHTAGECPTYDAFVGDAALKDIGLDAWKPRVRETVARCAALTNYDTLYLGGGNARFFTESEFQEPVRLAVNTAGLTGGAKLWGDCFKS